MPFTFVTPAIAISNIKMQWRQQYVTSGANKKMAGIIPSGIYRGLNLTTNVANNTISVVADAVHLDHLAVYETEDGFSLTFRDAANTIYTLTLTDPGLLSQTIVITMFLDYQEGKDTSATFIAYTLAEYNALSAGLRGELIVLGTVVNPASSNLISASAITPARRTVASFNQSLLAWRPLTINTGFERSPDNHVITGGEVEGWAFTDHWKTNSSDVASGTRCVEFNVPSAATYSENMKHYVGAGTIAGQKIMVKGLKKVVSAATGGTGQITVGYTAADGGSASEQTSTFIINATDGSYQDISNIFTAPAGAEVVKYVGISLTAAVYGSSGAKLRVDNLRAFLEPVSAEDMQQLNDNRLRLATFGGLSLEDVNSTSYGDLGALFLFKKNLPNTTEGEVQLLRKDGSTGASPAWSLGGRLINLGSSLIDSEANALLPRIDLPVSTATDTDYTLLLKATPSGARAIRLYLGTTGRFVLTSNFVWSNTQWTKDINGSQSSIMYLNGDELGAYWQESSNDLVAPEPPLFNLIQKRQYDIGIGGILDNFDTNIHRFRRTGYHYRDDFMGPLGSLYSSSNGSDGTCDKSSRPNAMYVQSGTAAKAYFRGLLDLTSFYKQSVVTFYARVMFGDAANGKRKFGLADGSDNLHVGFYQDNSTANVFAIGVGDYAGTGSGTGIDTFFKPTFDTYYYYLVHSSGSPGFNRTRWWISTTEDFNAGTVLSGSETVGGTQSALVLRPYFSTEEISATQPSITIDYWEGWSVLRDS